MRSSELGRACRGGYVYSKRRLGRDLGAGYVRIRSETPACRLQPWICGSVKRMPRAWTKAGFQQKYDEDCARLGVKSSCFVAENCWLDVGLTKYLDKQGVPFVCQPLGVFFSASETLIVSQFATEGDLFNFATGGPFPGGDRERWLCPLFKQIVHAVLWLHDRLIAHCDISMENILVTRDTEKGFLQVKLIDYCIATVGERLIVGSRGKPSYQAPEMFAGAYDQADAFSLGVVLYASASDRKSVV